MTLYGMPYFLEDKTGSLSGSDFVDINDRIRFSYRCTARDTTRVAYIIFNVTSGHSNTPVAALDFAPDGGWGTVTYTSGSTAGAHMAMKKYLAKTSFLGSTKNRKFTASDGNEYEWKWRQGADREWSCTNIQGETIAYYSLKVPGEPEYASSSGCTLTVEEAYPHLIVEMLTSLLIMRHIVESNLT